MKRSSILRLLLVPLVLGSVGLGFALATGGSAPRSSAAPAAYSPGAAVSRTGEASLTQVEQYWQNRLTYPTGRFDQRWVLHAAKQAARIKSGLPSGHFRARAGARSVKALGAARSLGPQPQESTGCQPPCFTFGLVSGRVSAIAFDPTNTSVAYIAQDGGGIWKTTNCCTPATTWTVTTDDPATVKTTTTDDVAVDPNNHNTVYAATGDISFGSFSFGTAGILKSTDAGAHWQTLGTSAFTPVYPPAAGGSFPQYQAVTKIKVDPNDSNKLVVGTKTGLYFSYDAGVNWSGPCLTNNYPGQRQDVTDLIIRDDGLTTSLYAAIGARGFATTVQQNLGLNGANGIYKLSSMPSSGCPFVASWTALTNGWPAGTASGTPCNPPINDNVTTCAAGANKVGRIEMAIAPSTLATPTPNDDVIYAEVQAIDPHARCGALQLLGDTTARGCFLGLWKTSDGGTTWTQTADATKLDPTTSPTAGPCGEDTPQMWYDAGVAVDPTNPNALYLDMIDVWKSTDGGSTMTDISCGYYAGLNPISAPMHVDNHVLMYQPGSSTTLLAGNDGGIYVSNNAANVPVATPTTIANPPTFKDVNATLSTIEFYGGDISANFATAANPFIVAGAQDNGSSFYQFAGTGGTCPPAGCQWSQRQGGDGLYARIEPKQGQRVFMETPNGGLQRSTTGPAGPYQAAAGGWGGERSSFIFPYQIDKFACPTATCDHMIAGSFRVWESIDGASSWYPNSPDLTKNTLQDRSYINELSYAPTTNGNAIVGTNDGNVQYGFGMGTGSADTATWVNLTAGNAVLPNRPIQDVAISPGSALTGYAAVGGFDENTPSTPGHVFQVVCSTFCNTFAWTNKTGNLPNIPVNTIAFNPNNRKQAFVGTDWGLYYTDDIKAPSPVWQHYAGMPNVMIWDLEADRGGTTLAVFTRSRGAWAIPLPTVSVTRVTLFSDDFDTPPQPKPWTVTPAAGCMWNEITSDSHSPTHSWTTHPYGDNCNTNFDSPTINIPAGGDSYNLSFWEHHDSESGANGGSGCPCDFGVVQMSIDGGSFQTISAQYDGTQPSWTQSVVSLPDSLAGHSVKFRWHFQSDGSVSDPVHQGWYIDDVSFSGEPPSGPTAVRLASFSAAGAHGAVRIRWRTASEAGTAGFNVWRFGPGSPVRLNPSLIRARGSEAKGAAYGVADRWARPGVAYTYRLQAIGLDGRREWRASARATPLR
jgi:hypothetical protein